MQHASDLVELANRLDAGARWLEQNARCPNDFQDPTKRTVVFDALDLDDFLTALRGMPGIVNAIAISLERRPNIRVLAGGRR